MPPRTVTITTKTTRSMTLGEVAHRAAYPETDWSLLHEQHRSTWERAAQAVADAIVNDETPWPDAPPVETPTEGDDLPRLNLLSGAKFGDRIRVSALIPPGLSREVKVGDRVAIESTMFRGGSGVLTVTEINGTLAQCSSHPQEPHGL